MCLVDLEQAAFSKYELHYSLALQGAPDRSIGPVCEDMRSRRGNSSLCTHLTGVGQRLTVASSQVPAD